jgi:hypothetical protein
LRYLDDPELHLPPRWELWLVRQLRLIRVVGLLWQFRQLRVVGIVGQ